MKTKTIVTAVVGLAVVGGVSYLAYRLYKQKKEEETNTISAEELRAEFERKKAAVEERSKREEALLEVDEDDPDDLKRRIIEIADSTLDAHRLRAILEKPKDDETTREELQKRVSKAYKNKIEEAISRREAEPFMWHDKDTIEAYEQYENMRLSDFEDPDVINTMSMLFEIPWNPTGERDKDLRHVILDDREEFFGPDSKWSNTCSVAELILYFAESADFEIDGGVEPYCQDWLSRSGISHKTGKATLDQRLEDLLNHKLLNSFGFGLFSLDEEAYEKVLEHPSMMLPNSEMAFKPQFDIWLGIMIDLLGEDDEEDYDRFADHHIGD